LVIGYWDLVIASGFYVFSGILMTIYLCDYMQEIIVPRLGKKFGYVVSRKYKRVGLEDLRQIIAFYMDKGSFFVAQWCRNLDGSGDYKKFSELEISREEFFFNFFYEDEGKKKPRGRAPTSDKKLIVKK
jgi:hypothetical protein